MSDPQRRIDLNADLGEGCPSDDALLEIVTSTSIACGAHAGDELVARRTLRRAARRGVAVGAHPGFADREGFGRREQAVSSAEVEDLIRSQFDWLNALASGCGVPLRFVKPHGALYNQAQRAPEVAEGIVRALRWLALPVLGQPGSILQSVAREAGVRFVAEGFPDRRYRPDGRLLARSEPGAVLEELPEIEAQALRLVEQGLETLCIHGDQPQAVENARGVRSALQGHGIALGSFV